MIEIVQTTREDKRNKIAKLRNAVSIPSQGLPKNVNSSTPSIAKQVRNLYRVGNKDANQNIRQTLILLFGNRNPVNKNSFVNALAIANNRAQSAIERTGVTVARTMAGAAERPVLSEINTGGRGTISKKDFAQKQETALKKSGSTVRQMMNQKPFKAVDVARYASANIKTLLGKDDAAAAEQIRLRLKKLSSSATNVSGMKKELGIQNLNKKNALIRLTEIIMKEQLKRQIEGEQKNMKLESLAKNLASMSAGLGNKLANTRSEQLEGFLSRRTTTNTNRLKVIKEALQKHVLGVNYPNDDDFKKAKAVISLYMLPSLSQRSFRDALREEIRGEKIVDGQRVYFAKLPIYPLFESYDKLYDRIKALNKMNANAALNEKSKQIKSIAENVYKMNALQRSLIVGFQEDIKRAKEGQRQRKARNATEIGKIQNARQAQTLQNQQLQRNTVQVFNENGVYIEFPSITFQNMIAKGIDGRWVRGQTNEFNGQTPKWFTINKGKSRGYSLTAYPPQEPTASSNGNATQRNNGNVANANANKYFKDRGNGQWNTETHMTKQAALKALQEGNFVLLQTKNGTYTTMVKQGNNFVPYSVD